MPSLQRIQENSTELRRLNDRIKETFQVRSKSIEHKAQWEQACAEFHSRFDELSFPGGLGVFERVRENDPIALEAAIQFLLADPMHFRSGYLKEHLWRWLPHCNLSKSARNRLESAALKYLSRRISREFWCMCKTMAQLGQPKFWLQVSAQSQKSNSPEGFRAFCLLTHGASVQAGSTLRRNIYRSWLHHKYGES